MKVVSAFLNNPRKAPVYAFMWLRLLLLFILILPCSAMSAKQDKAQGELNMLEMAVVSFSHDYRRMPIEEREVGGTNVVRVLIAEDPERNPNNIVYLELETSARDGIFLDPWGTQYRIHLDHDGDGEIVIAGTTNAFAVGTQSAGPDGVFETKDDQYSSRLVRTMKPYLQLQRMLWFALGLVLFAALAFGFAKVRTLFVKTPAGRKKDGLFVCLLVFVLCFLLLAILLCFLYALGGWSLV